jgi:hypothetical protein
VAGTLGGQIRAGVECGRFPRSNAESMRYATVDRGNLVDVIFHEPSGNDAVKRGQPIPSGTVLPLAGYKAKLDDQGNPLRDASGRLVPGNRQELLR